jgi:Tol biopolymer transport system component
MSEGRDWHLSLARNGLAGFRRGRETRGRETSFARPRLVLAVAMLGALAILVTAPPGARAAFNGNNGKIVFTSSRDANFEIYSMNADGSAQTDLTNNSAGDIAPEWSADGTKIAFTSFRDSGNAEIYVMNSDGTGQTRLTNDAAVDSNATWSPDGQKIAFRSDRSGGDWDIYAMNADGTAQTNLTNSPGLDDLPAWSPDGSTIAFQSGRDGNYEIYAMNADGTGQVDLTNDPDADRNPTWSPGGTKIAFDTSRDGNLEIYSMNADGTAQTDLTTNASDDSEPAWSPDSTKITFRSQRDGNAEIYATAANGTGQSRLTNNTAYDSRPNWQPVIPGFARPKGATPVRAPLTIAYVQCTSSFNKTHSPPLVAPACSPPAQTSGNLTVGTLDVNGLPAGFSGSVSYMVHIGQPGPPDDSDVLIDATLTDVRCNSGVSTCESGALSDYTGNLQATATMQITDKYNGLAPTGGPESATVTDMPLPATVPCTATATSTGALCSIDTSVNSLIPGAIKDAKRQILQLGQVEVFDGGPDGDVSTLPNDLFATEGLWVP